MKTFHDSICSNQFLRLWNQEEMDNRHYMTSFFILWWLELFKYLCFVSLLFKINVCFLTPQPPKREKETESQNPWYILGFTEHPISTSALGGWHLKRRPLKGLSWSTRSNICYRRDIELCQVTFQLHLITMLHQYICNMCIYEYGHWKHPWTLTLKKNCSFSKLKLYFFVIITTLCPVSWGCRIHWLLLCRGVRLFQWVSWIWH